MALSLPSLICLKSEFNSNYLRFQQDRTANTHALLQVTESNVLDHYIQFELVKAKKDGFFHLKCRYNNKFLVRWVPDKYWISASADWTNEDEKSWNCTLFKPTLVEDGETKKIRFEHAQIGYNLIIWSAPGFDSCLMVGSSKDAEPNKRDLFSIVDWGSVFKLPKRVAFVSINKDGKHLHLGAAVVDKGQRTPLRFIYEDAKDPKVEHEVVQYNNGIVCIKNTYTGKYWTYVNDDPSYERIFAIADDPRRTNNVNGMFRPNVLGINLVGFLNMGKKWYCKRHSYVEIGEGFLCATTQNVERFTEVHVVDLDKLQ